MLSVLIASAIGAVCRYLLERFNHPQFPLFTMLINILGSFIAGIAFSQDSSMASSLIAFSGTFTTFSGLIAGTHSILKSSKLKSFLYGHGSIILSIVAAWIGLSIH